MKPCGLDDLLHRLVTDAGLGNDLGHVDLFLLRHGHGNLDDLLYGLVDDALLALRMWGLSP